MFRPIGNSPKVAPNLRELDPQKPLAVIWEKTTAFNGTKVYITGRVQNPNHAIKPTVWILFNKVKYVPAQNVQISNGQITAEWVITPKNVGAFTAGEYDVEVTYGSLTATTKNSLRIVRPGGNPNASYFG